MDLLTGANLVLVLIGFCLLILLHELGHHLAAKWAGIRVENFAIGMGPVLCSWRKGIGLRLGSTHAAVMKRLGKSAVECPDTELAAAGIGETEYTLRAFPLGGYVQMLGQDDMAPGRAQTGARSFMSAPVGKRMIVISAGVVANLVVAIVMFLVAFLVGVQFEGPVIGSVMPASPAEAAGLRAGDRVTSVDGSPVATFSDIQIAAALNTPDAPLQLLVRRGGNELEFTTRPSPINGMRSIGIAPASGTELVVGNGAAAAIHEALLEAGFWSNSQTNSALPAGWKSADGSAPTERDFSAAYRGARLETIDGVVATTATDLALAAESGGGQPMVTIWSIALTAAGESSQTGPAVTLTPAPAMQRMVDPALASDAPRVNGILGIAPLVRVAQVPSDSANAAVLKADDLILSVGTVAGPNYAVLRETLKAKSGESVKVTLLRDGSPVEAAVRVSTEGLVGFVAGEALDVPAVAAPIAKLAAADGTVAPTPFATLGLPPLSVITSIGGQTVTDWDGIGRAMRAAAVSATASIAVEAHDLTDPKRHFNGTLTLTAADLTTVQSLGWASPLPAALFSPAYATLSANGNPLRAVAMGMRESWKVVVLTYLTLDRLFRGTVGVDQLRGPVGIVHIGTRVADRGLTYLVFFLAMISVNLAVLNFLPLPVVDGGHRVYLLYEKSRGVPPSTRFQSAATFVGLALLAGIFLVTFYNDVLRLVR